jgi:hypothetical protein
LSDESFFIELPSETSPVLELAARELSEYVSLTTGRRPAEAKGESVHLFVLGTRASGFDFLNILENLTPAALGTDGFRILSDESKTTFCAETDKGVLNAVYFFIERVLGVRWVEPGEFGEVLPRGRVRDGSPLDLTEVPAFAIRGMHITENSGWYREGDVVKHLEWMARNRLNRLVIYSNYSYERLRRVVVNECRHRGITLEVEILSLNQFLPMSLFDAHPEYFPVVEAERVGRSFVQRCASNAEAIALYVRNAVEWVRQHPEADVVSLMPNDGSGFCGCASCRKMKPNEQWAKFLHPALEALKAEFPGRRFASRVTCYRYDAVPGDAEARRGVGMMFDTFLRCRWHELGSEKCTVETRDPEVHDTRKGQLANVYLLNALKEWKGISTGPTTVFENVASHGLLSTPVPNPECASHDLETYHALGLDGVIVLAHVHSFGSYLLNFSLFARKSWDLSADYRGLWPDLCVRTYGGYGVRVLDYHERLLEAVARDGYGCRGLTARMTERDWKDIEELLGPPPEDEELDVFDKRYLRLRESFFYLRELARMDSAGEKLRLARGTGDHEGAIDAARDAFTHLLKAWETLDRNYDSGMFDTFDVQAKLLTRAINTDDLLVKYPWFPKPFWYIDDPRRRLIFWDHLMELESQGLPIDDIHHLLGHEFDDARDRLTEVTDGLDEILDDLDIGLDRV